MTQICKWKSLQNIFRNFTFVGDGPIEPRLFPFYNQTYISFNSAVHISKHMVDTTMFWDFANDKFVMPLISHGQPQLQSKTSMPRDKHWSPFTHNDKFYLIYSIDPLRILYCNKSSQCRFVQNNADKHYKFDNFRDSLRGGTPTIHYSDNYYIMVAHSTLYKRNKHYTRYYSVNLVVLRINSESDHQVIYLSAPIRFHPKLMNSIPIVRHKYIDNPFLFPVSLLLESRDSVVIGGHINDHSSYLLRFTGLRELMSRIMSRKVSSTGPPNTLLHNLTRQFASDISGYEFMS